MKLSDAGTARSKDAGAVGFVHDDDRAALFGNITHRRQVREVAVHGENGIRHQKFHTGGFFRRRAVVPSWFIEKIGGTWIVAMGEGAAEGFGIFCGVEQAGVIQFVGDDQVVRAGEGGKDGEVGHETGGEEEGSFGAFEAGEGGFEVVVEGHRAGDEAGCGGTGAEAGGGVAGGVDDFGVGGEAEVVVGAELEVVGAVDGEGGFLRGIDAAELSEEMLFAPGIELRAEPLNPVGARAGARMKVAHGRP